ncbi:hypothetical protein [Pseudonocardia sp. MH-G8]|uniref:hypothetical protein n=1 Tax=Pseudonocardia sp. MH-G8 TaxID=1854588 RepID=UPI000BA107CA|nr:hypothetical protein [Pseudonocardia sp. MH-G8]OZM82309.1 hypothetical protein CFP66_11110 [Pseudonocardia sp. MH-G8]
MTFWWTAMPGGGCTMGEAPDEAEARLEIARAQGRASVRFHERSGRYRWAIVMDDEKTSHGWADTESDAWWFVKEAVNRPYRLSYQRAPRGLFSQPPES